MFTVNAVESQGLCHDLDQPQSCAQRLRRMIELQERERCHLARELHDDVGQLLTLIKISASSVLRHLIGDQEQRLAALVRVADEALGKVRNLSNMLRPAPLDSVGLIEAMHRLVERVPSDMPDGVRVRLECAELEPRPDACVEVTLFRIFQEALNNVLRHGGASLVEVTLRRRNDGIHLTINDNGSGFDTAGVRQSGKGMGLMNMAEPARLFAAEFTLDSGLGRGTRIALVIPDSNMNKRGAEA
jgi:signal transduction histidine kinase